MKINHKANRGFTLIEVMVVVMIVVVLMSLVVGAMQWVKISRMEQQSRVMTQRVVLALNEFYNDNGFYPDGDGREESTKDLYAALFGDKDGDGVPDQDKKGKRSTIYMEELDPYHQGSEPLVMKHGNGYIMVDPWGTPFRYRIGFQQKDSRNREGTGKNPDFDFWSAGKDGVTDLKNNEKTGANEDDIGNT